MAFHLNWRELESLVEKARPNLVGLFVDRLILPARDHFPEGYLKGEWCLRLSDRKKESCLLFSVRPQHPYIAWASGKGPKAAQSATHSSFDLILSKEIRGRKLTDIV